ncbi:hypothetical protein Hanom_Chr13g01228501 [Helianthus anomalus]
MSGSGNIYFFIKEKQYKIGKIGIDAVVFIKVVSEYINSLINEERFPSTALTLSKF